jgi:OOP family OmpA-OmpF porin
MDQTTERWIRGGLGLLVPFILLVPGCAPSQQEMLAKNKLERARAVYLEVKGNPVVEAYAPMALSDARKTLDAAEQTKDYKIMEHLSYLAEIKSQTALVLAEGSVAEKEREVLSREAVELQLWMREHEIELARKEVEARTREADQARLVAAAEAARADRSRKDAEEARRIALAETEKADRARLMALQEVERADKAKREAERARSIALAEAAEAEKAKREAAERAQEAERARKEAEAKVRETEQTRAEMDQLSRELSDLKAKQTERGIVLTMGDVLFESGKASLSSEAVRNVEKLAGFLQQHPSRNLLIEGHTDSVGSDEFNVGLSEKRAGAVKDQLVASGINQERITTIGYGKQYPVAGNDTPAGRQQNRRVEMVILNEGVAPETQFRQ